MMSAAVAFTSSGRIAFTVAAVPTGMKAGVRILPRCIVIAPVRALPSVAEMEKENLGEAISALLISVGGRSNPIDRMRGPQPCRRRSKMDNSASGRRVLDSEVRLVGKGWGVRV